MGVSPNEGYPQRGYRGYVGVYIPYLEYQAVLRAPMTAYIRGIWENAPEIQDLHSSLHAPRLSRHCLCRNGLRLPNRYRLSSNVSRLVAPWYCEGIEGIKGTRVKPSQWGPRKHMA